MSENNQLTREQAKQAIQDGKKVRHHYFTDEEFIVKHSEGKLTDNYGAIMDETEFWKYRSNIMFNNNWSIIE